MECDAFIIGEQLKEERLRAGLTQEQLADRIGTKKSFISRVEKGHADIQLLHPCQTLPWFGSTNQCKGSVGKD